MTSSLTKPALPFDLGRPYRLAREDKQTALISALNELTAWHAQQCDPYRRMVQAMFGDLIAARTLEELPYLPVRLFKSIDLRSVAEADVAKTLTSSGTTGQAVSKIYLDRETAVRQTRVLGAIVADFLGPQRMPMVVVDSAELLNDRTRFNARAAGILGFSVFGRLHHYCLDEQLNLRFDELQAYLEAHRHTPILVFGFTSVIWKSLYRTLADRGLHIDFGPGSTLIHGGGWKRLREQQVSNAVFKKRLGDQTGIERVINYYGMVEQVGSIFLECEEGHLHSPVFADVVVRDPITLESVPFGTQGVLEVFSALPLSYPGHVLLTEDMGIIHGEDDCPCGRNGRYFSVLGRLPQAEIRGCSDTRVMP
jgi:phenylacetate-coenzyme A ligase PaaK-like adenylate-forming protein